MQYSSAQTTGALLLLAAASTYHCCSAASFQEVIDVIEERKEELSQHKLFKYMADESIPAKRRMQFVPYWTYFAVSAADLTDAWIRIPDPQTELERRVNVWIDEDNFHYNFFLHDVENVLGYTLDRFGSFGAVLRHLWGDDSKAVRMLIYAWGSGVKKSKDPLVILASFEAMEAGLQHLFEVTYNKISKGKNDFEYFGQTHVELEAGHTVASWSEDGDQPYRPLAIYEVTEETKKLCLEVVEDLFYW